MSAKDKADPAAPDPATKRQAFTQVVDALDALPRPDRLDVLRAAATSTAWSW